MTKLLKAVDRNIKYNHESPKLWRLFVISYNIVCVAVRHGWWDREACINAYRREIFG